MMMKTKKTKKRGSVPPFFIHLGNYPSMAGEARHASPFGLKLTIMNQQHTPPPQKAPEKQTKTAPKETEKQNNNGNKQTNNRPPKSCKIQKKVVSLHYIKNNNPIRPPPQGEADKTMTTTTKRAPKGTKTTKQVRTTFYIVNDNNNMVLHVMEQRTEKGAIKSAQTYLKQHRSKHTDCEHATLYADQPCGGIYRVKGFYRQH